MGFNNGERGGVLITVAIALVLLMGITALAIDGSAAYNERRSTQNTADNTALAAAWAHCMDTVDDPVGHAEAIALANGFEPSEIQIESMDPGDYDGQYRARVISVNSTYFARTIGTEEMTVLSEATAACVRSQGGGAFAMFTKGPACELIKGGNAKVAGNVYSAGDMTWNGGGSQYIYDDVHADGNITSHGEFNLGPGGTGSATGTADHPSIQTGVPPRNLEYPVDYHTRDFSPNSAIAVAAGDNYFDYLGNVNANAIRNNGPGIHYVDGNASIQNLNEAGKQYTIVATGSVTGAAQKRFTPYYEGLAVMAGIDRSPNCTRNDIDFSGQTDIWGLLFAPNGRISINGGTVNGGLIGWAIDTSGSLELDVDVSLFPSGTPHVFLLN